MKLSSLVPQLTCLDSRSVCVSHSEQHLTIKPTVDQVTFDVCYHLYFHHYYCFAVASTRVECNNSQKSIYLLWTLLHDWTETLACSTTKSALLTGLKTSSRRMQPCFPAGRRTSKIPSRSVVQSNVPQATQTQLSSDQSHGSHQAFDKIRTALSSSPYFKLNVNLSACHDLVKSFWHFDICIDDSNSQSQRRRETGNVPQANITRSWR